jgi:hypothetical protein
MVTITNTIIVPEKRHKEQLTFFTAGTKIFKLKEKDEGKNNVLISLNSLSFSNITATYLKKF